MKGNYFNKGLGIGPGEIGCGCCVDFPKKRKNHKKLYSTKRRKIEKIFFRKLINKAISSQGSQ
jgi:hypothetical protein